MGALLCIIVSHKTTVRMRVSAHISTEHDSCLLAVFGSLSVLESFLNCESAALERDTSGCLWRGSGQIRAQDPAEVQQKTDKT